MAMLQLFRRASTIAAAATRLALSGLIGIPYGIRGGGGRGVFSYYLVEGLYGLADDNNDQQVSLLEVGRYLEDKVSAAVAPNSQLPMTVGNRTEVLSNVVPDLLAKYQQQAEATLPAENPNDGNPLASGHLSLIHDGAERGYKAAAEAGGCCEIKCLRQAHQVDVGMMDGNIFSE